MKSFTLHTGEVMPRQRNFDSLYKSLNIKREKETPRIPDSELPSNNLKEADHSLCDFLFEDYSDGKGYLIWKRKTYKIDDEQLKQFRNSSLKDRGE